MAPVVREHAKPKNMKKTLKFLWRYFRKHKAVLLLVTVMIAVSALANVYGTYLLKPVVNDFIMPGDIPGLARELLFMAAMYLVGVLATYGYTQLMVKVAQQLVRELRDDLFRKVQTLPLRFFDAKTHGELMSRFTSDIDTIAEALNNSLAPMIQSVILIIGTFAVLLLLNVTLTLIVAAAFLCMFLFIRHSGKKSHEYFTSQQKYMGSLNGFVEEMVEGQKVVKIFNHEAKDFVEFSKRNKRLQEAATGALTYSGLMIPVIVSISYFNYALSACIGAFFAISGRIDIGTLASYLIYVRQIAIPFNQFSQQANFVLAALAGAERILEIMDERPETDEGTVTLVNVTEEPSGALRESAARTGKWAWRTAAPDGAFAFVPLRGDVRFNDVVFAYQPGNTILKGINLYAKPGQKIAFVGSTGAGKTTIANLLSRFYDVTSGSITYDGIDVRAIKKDDLRHSLAVVLQDTHLFTGTIADNIRYGFPDATMEQVVAAAQLANADSFIQRLPDGYDTLLTGDGTNLSQGQRQLLAIARAAVANPPVLILDEATSSVDTHTEKLIETGMDHLMENRTVFVIAHRLSTIRNAKAIIVLENGSILERGSHDELIEEKGRYFQLYTGQFELD
ncbi:ATP-binding cassette, subfamily B [Sporobacter termitidis DSM 10068]|uniref:ATP-binding cassette, subfamily B n=1 Tax=Sporobacter termitidis DSM 10068 TaxID=1123282 RepID=A0A1M5VH24_9FIRM|nr:ABC transporter ATP-binding protein [Sporobacter termitidis]SHH74488.1 ATP-binding cassette, subfamily B [Sporobacter termitidis DSM 10068]